MSTQDLIYAVVGGVASGWASCLLLAWLPAFYKRLINALNSHPSPED